MKRKFIDDNGKFFGFISIIDIFVIIIAVILAVAIYLKFNVKEVTITDAGEYVSIGVIINNVRNSAYDSVRIGDDIYCGAEKIGKISDISIEPCSVSMTCNDGTIKKVDHPAKVDVTITINAFCTENNGTYYTVNNIPLNFYSWIDLNTKYNTFSGCILGVSK